MLGISLYPEKASFNEMKNYLALAKSYGFQRVFLSLLQIDRNNVSESMEKYLKIIKEAREQEFEVAIDFIPQQYTGLSREQFKQYSIKFCQSYLTTAAFVTSQSGEHGPWPLQEGLCTLEEHRHLPIGIQVRDLLQSGLIDDVLIGTMFASEEELRQVSEAAKDSMKKIDITLVEDITAFERQLLFDYTHNYRGDSSDYMIRSTRLRAKIVDKPLPSNHPVQMIKEGDILILNEAYGQYKGEVQIALKDRPGDKKINLVGHIPEDRLFEMKNIQRFEDFRFCEVNKQYD
ncbi:MupG family TIM beta-alpha barrel fold protein [Enterococcus hirae]|uniref:MupG family TIM beta-alpha barrel fold protein n=1 Tax=Enterococcus hirae TaxID=1354 RepID=UPI002091314C|nr:MupG family TIM beta-alpha barrel fold protein [Enterococcus hirae]